MELQTEVEPARPEPPAEQEGQDASEQEALATAVPDVEIAPRAEQKGL